MAREKRKETQSMLELKNVYYGYTAARAVMRNLDLRYDEPGVYGLLGMNGSGKSTLLYLMMGLLRPKGGSVTMNGKETWRRDPEVMREMFLVPEEFDLPRTRLDKYVESMSVFYPNFDMDLLKQTMEIFGLNGLNGAPEGIGGVSAIDLRGLSMGQKKKIYLCVALAARTQLLLMDEPTNGLDIPSKSQFRKVVAHGMRDDQIIVISTHQVRDVEALIDHVSIMKDGRIEVNRKLDVEEPTNLEEVFMKAIIGGAAQEEER